MSDKQSKYEAGRATAETDRKRGMSLADMDKVATVPGDNPEWARGYRDRLAGYRASAGQKKPRWAQCRDCGAPGAVDGRGLGLSCGCASE